MTDGRSERARAKREETRARILVAAEQVFATKGYHDTGVADLVEAAGVARGTFYQYFDSKHAIFLELLDELLRRFRASVVGVDVSAGAETVRDQLVGIVTRVFHAAAEHRTLARIVFREAVGLDADVDDRLQDFEINLYTYVRNALTLGRELGWLREHDPEVVATLVYGGLRQLIDRRIVRGQATSDALERAAVATVDHHLRGLLREEDG